MRERLEEEKLMGRRKEKRKEGNQGKRERLEERKLMLGRKEELRERLEERKLMGRRN